MTEERDEGQAAVELALVLPLLVILLLAVAQVTLVARDQVLVVHAARAGARQAAVDDGSDAVRQAAADASGLKSSRLRVETTAVGPVPRLVRTRVRFVASTDVALIGPLLPDVTLEATAAMRSEMSGSTTQGEGTTTSQQEPTPAGANPAATGMPFPGPRPVNG